MKMLGIWSWVPQGLKDFVKKTFRPVFDFIKDLLGLKTDTDASLVFLGMCLLVLLILVLVIVLCAKKAKAKRLAKAEKPEDVKEVAEVKEVNPISEEKIEVKEETPVVEDVKETPVVEETLVAKEEKSVAKAKAAPKAKKAPVAEEKVEVKEETPVEEKPVEETHTSRILLGKFEVFPVSDVFLYRLKASNGEILVVSEMYKTSKGALSAIETVKKNIEVGTIQIQEDKHGLFQFKLFATNKRLLVNSANYTTYQSCENAAESFKKFAAISPISILEEDPEKLMEEIQLMALTNKKNGKLHIVEVEDEYEFLLKASNGVLLCKSATYKTKASLTNAISSFKEAIKKGKFFVVKDKNDMFQFKLYSEASRCVVVGEAYKTKAQAVSAANSVASFVTLADVVDMTIKETV